MMSTDHTASLRPTAFAPDAKVAQSNLSSRRAVQLWLLLIAGLVFAMVIVGGATRLTGSGLSITEWQPILGALPPTSASDWQTAFEKYQAIPQYELINKGMSLDEFKNIYWWEWGHRLLGRAIGFVFLLPFAYFLWRKAIPKPFILPIAALFLLGGSQGLLGWLMVKSGLADRVDVSQYRLAAHLGLAVAIGGFALWLAMAFGRHAIGDGNIRSKPLRNHEASSASDKVPAFRRLTTMRWAGCLAGLIYLQIIVGAFVAGLKAGHISDTWPLMLGSLIPDGLGGGNWRLSPFEDPLTAQFLHRVLGYLVAIAAAIIFVRAWKQETSTRTSSAPVDIRLPITLACAAIAVQIALGVATIVYAVPLKFALAHQANAVIVFALALWFLHRAYAASACSRSAMMSSASSRPTESRTTSSPAPARVR